MLLLLFSFVLSRELKAEDEESVEYYEYVDYDDGNFDIDDNEFFPNYHPEFDQDMNDVEPELVSDPGPDDLIQEKLNKIDAELKKREMNDENSLQEDGNNLNQNNKDSDEQEDMKSKINKAKEERKRRYKEHIDELNRMREELQKRRKENPPVPISVTPRRGSIHGFNVIARLDNFNGDGCKCRFNGTFVVKGFEVDDNGCLCEVPPYEKECTVSLEVAEYDELTWVPMGNIQLAKKQIIRNLLLAILFGGVLLLSYQKVKKQRRNALRKKRSSAGYSPLSNQVV